MTDRDIMQQALEALELLSKQPIEMALDYADNAIDALRERLAQPEQRPVPPPWWPAVENILNEYGLQAIDFVDDFKKALAQSEREWVGLTDAELAEFSETKLGAYDLCLEVEAKLREKNNG